MTLNRKEQREFERWARRGMKGIKESACFVAFNEPGADPLRTLQLGAAVLLGKPFLLLAPEGTEIPPKLRAVADSIQYFVSGDPESMAEATRRGLEAMGVVKH